MHNSTRHRSIRGRALRTALLALLASAPFACGGGDSSTGGPGETTGAGAAGPSGDGGGGGSVATGGGSGGAGGVVVPCDPDEDPENCGGGSGGAGVGGSGGVGGSSGGAGGAPGTGGGATGGSGGMGGYGGGMGGGGEGGSGGGTTQPPLGIDWSGGFGDTNDQQGHAVAVDAMGNTVVTGRFKGTINFGGAPLTAAGTDFDVFVAKFDPAGNHLWSKRFGNEFAQWGRGIACDSAGNILMTGEFYGSIDFGGGPLNVSTNNTNTDIFVAKLDPDGNYIWSYRYGDASHQRGYAVAVDPADNVLVSGGLWGTLAFGNISLQSNDRWDAIILKLSPTGAPLWGGHFGNAGDQHAYGIASDAAGNIFVTGMFNGIVNFGNGNLTSNGWSADTDPDFFFAVFGSNGSHVCAFDAGNSGWESGNAIAVGPDGNAYVTGSFNHTIVFNPNPAPDPISLSTAGSNDVFVAKIEPDCHTLWASRHGNNGNQVGYGISVDGEGNPWVIGDFSGTINFNGGDLISGGSYDVFVARLAPNGAHLFSGKAGDSAAQAGRGIAGGPGGYASLAGYYQGNMGWTGHPVLSGGANNNVFVSRLVP